MPNDQTSRGYPLPHPDNIAVQDVVRIRDAITHIDADVAQLTIEQQKMNGALNRLTLETFLHVGLLDAPR